MPNGTINFSHVDLVVHYCCYFSHPSAAPSGRRFLAKIDESRAGSRNGLSFAKILSGLNAFEISNLQEQETESRYPGDPDVTMLHRAVKLLNGVFADHRQNFSKHFALAAQTATGRRISS